MSKIGKRAMLLLLALPIGFNVMAQETKKPTLEELIPGGESYRYADNLYGLQWWGDPLFLQYHPQDNYSCKA